MSEQEKTIFDEEAGLDAIPLERRTSWVSPAMVYAGCEFCIPVIMIGSGLVAGLGFKQAIWAIILGLVVITWLGDGLNSWLGAMTGRSSSVIARASFGTVQARVIIALAVLLMSGGWWAVQTAVTGNALCTMFGIDYTTNYGMWALITIIAGIIFAISYYQDSSMEWTDYIAVPAGMILVVVAFVLAIRGTGWQQIVSFVPQESECYHVCQCYSWGECCPVCHFCGLLQVC